MHSFLPFSTNTYYILCFSFIIFSVLVFFVVIYSYFCPFDIVMQIAVFFPFIFSSHFCLTIFYLFFFNARQIICCNQKCWQNDKIKAMKTGESAVQFMQFCKIFFRFICKSDFKSNNAINATKIVINLKYA